MLALVRALRGRPRDAGEDLAVPGTAGRELLNANTRALNKGPYIVDAAHVLDDILTRMQAHQHKKSSMLRGTSTSPNASLLHDSQEPRWHGEGTERQ